MTVTATLIGRLKKFLRVEFEIKTGTVTADSALGESPMGFADQTIQSEFRIRLNNWFDDMIDPFPIVDWDGTTTLSDLATAIIAKSKIKDIEKAAVYRAHVLDLATRAFETPPERMPRASRLPRGRTSRRT